MWVIVGILVLSVIFIWRLCASDFDDVPGPPALPIIGHLHLIGGKALHLLLRELSFKYGDVFKLKLGSQRTLILSSRKVVKEAFVKQAKIFAGRPHIPTFAKTLNGLTGLSLCSYTEEYKSNKAIAVAAIHNFLSNEGVLDQLLKGEAAKMNRFLDKYAASQKQFFPSEEFQRIVPSLFVSLMFRREYDYDDQEMDGIINTYKTWFDVAEADNPADFFPVMMYLPNRRLDIVQKCSIAFDNFTMAMINKFEHVSTDENYDENKGSLFDALLMQYTNRNKTTLSIPEKKRLGKVLSDMIGGGFDTVASTLSWAMLYLLNQPEVLENCRRELCQYSELSIINKNDLPYFSATIHEIFRLSTIAPLGVSHSTIKDTTFMGYHIPKDTMVLANLWQMNHDPERWEVPDLLHPQHFLTDDGKLDTVSVREMMSFSTGVRQCIGKQLAFVMVYSLLGTIIKRYDCSIVKYPQDMIPQRGLTLKPKHYTMVVSQL